MIENQPGPFHRRTIETGQYIGNRLSVAGAQNEIFDSDDECQPELEHNAEELFNIYLQK